MSRGKRLISAAISLETSKLSIDDMYNEAGIELTFLRAVSYGAFLCNLAIMALLTKQVSGLCFVPRWKLSLKPEETRKAL